MLKKKIKRSMQVTASYLLREKNTIRSTRIRNSPKAVS
jgi:hypothetical protein